MLTLPVLQALHHHGFALLDVEEPLAAAPSNLIDAAGGPTSLAPAQFLSLQLISLNHSG